MSWLPQSVISRRGVLMMLEVKGPTDNVHIHPGEGGGRPGSGGIKEHQVHYWQPLCPTSKYPGNTYQKHKNLFIPQGVGSSYFVWWISLLAPEWDRQMRQSDLHWLPSCHWLPLYRWPTSLTLDTSLSAIITIEISSVINWRGRACWQFVYQIYLPSTDTLETRNPD